MSYMTQQFSIVGPDIEHDMLRVLTTGDPILAEINGVRLFSTSDNPPIATENPWKVEYNEPGSHLIISNPQLPEPIQLEYSLLATSGEYQPAVFHITSGPLITKRTPLIWVILQLVSCRTDVVGVKELQEPFNVDEFRDYLDDDRVKLGIFDAFIPQITRLSRSGWRLQSANRFRLRANISMDLLQAFRHRDYQAMLKATDEQLERIAREFHTMSVLARLSSMIQHDPIAVANVAKYDGRPRQHGIRHGRSTVENEG